MPCGAVLAEKGHLVEAESVYRADLGLDDRLGGACQHPGNVWSLHGLRECLKRRGETLEARHIRLQQDRALARAEVPIEASCCCRQPRSAPPSPGIDGQLRGRDPRGICQTPDPGCGGPSCAATAVRPAGIGRGSLISAGTSAR